ncbi:hypothetical protein [Thomasclavelia saccharogumia]|nr:hypothetical protein [Thomasclavelia saccharogumia]
MKKDVDLKKMSRAELEQKYIELATKNEALGTVFILAPYDLLVPK